MGMRRNVALVYEDKRKIYIYTHWMAAHTRQTLKDALARGRDRWGDESYLARIIFSEFVKDDIEGTTGYGLAPYECDPEYPTITVDLEKCIVDDMPFDAFIAEDFTGRELK